VTIRSKISTTLLKQVTKIVQNFAPPIQCTANTSAIKDEGYVQKLRVCF
jgi:hypothetical protein